VAVIVNWDGLQVVVVFIDSFMDDVTYVRDVSVCPYSVICYKPGSICYGSTNVGLGSLHYDCDELAGTTPQFHSVAPYTFNLFSIDGLHFCQ
jgi:hypothetical protein